MNLQKNLEKKFNQKISELKKYSNGSLGILFKNGQFRFYNENIGGKLSDEEKRRRVAGKEAKKKAKQEAIAKKKAEKDQPKHEAKKKVEVINAIIYIEFTDGYNIVYLVLLLILFLSTIDLWCCVSVAQFKNEPYYIHETKDQRQLEEKKNIVRKQLQK